MALLDLLGRRWALRVLWELRDGVRTSRELRTACDEFSPSVLQTRVDELREAALVELTEDGYRLTGLGEELLKSFPPLYAFSERWARELAMRARPRTK
ncbi:MAG: transcriptional regulator [Myxococcaceae bacterium]|nr:transcriptional regulator [Myxococcaceae bacterium]